MTALRWIGAACRITALAAAVWAVLAGWRPMLDILATHEVRIELRPLGMPFQPPPNRWI
jgi:hypothetical protein